MDRLEDLRNEWQLHCQNTFDAFLSESPRGASLRDWSEKTLVPLCFAWLNGRGCWPTSWIDNETTRKRAEKQVIAALQHLPENVMPPSSTTLEVPGWSWSISAGVGALTGMLIGAPLSLLLTGDRLMGLTLGGVAGAAALTALVGFLADRPQLRKVIVAGLAFGSTLTAIGGVWKTLKGNSGSTSFFRISGIMLACFVVLFLARPRLKPTGETTVAEVNKALNRLALAHGADLVLAWIWAHPDRTGPAFTQTSSSPIPDQFIEAMTELQRETRAGCEEAYDNYAEEMLHQFQVLGYEWLFVSRGSQFDEKLRVNFVAWGIEPCVGDPVRTIKPAITLRGANLIKGQLQRIKN
jgi:hypothetical protein